MKRTSLEGILKPGQSYYSLIIVISKMARKIVDDANEATGTCPDNPVLETVELLKTKSFEIIEPDELKH